MDLIEDLVSRGVDDWVADAELIDIAGRIVTTPVDRRTVAIGLVAEALLRGLVEAGDVSRGGFAAWGCSAADALERIAKEWLAADDPLVTHGEIAWLSNTASGDALGNHVLARAEPYD